MLVFYKEQNSTRLNKIILERAKRNWNRAFGSTWNVRSATGTAFGLLARAKRSWNHPTGLRAP